VRHDRSCRCKTKTSLTAHAPSPTPYAVARSALTPPPPNVCRTRAHWQVKKLTYFALKAAIFPAVCVLEVGPDAARARALPPRSLHAPSHPPTHAIPPARAPFPFLTLSHSIFPPRSRSQVGGAEYEGQTVGMGAFTNDLVKDQWPDLKPTTPNGQLPTCTLEDGSVIPESGAIMRACAAQTGLLGTGKDFVISEMLIGMTGDLVKDTFGGYAPRLQ
jgi:hypothetical protein